MTLKIYHRLHLLALDLKFIGKFIEPCPYVLWRPAFLGYNPDYHISSWLSLCLVLSIE